MSNFHPIVLLVDDQKIIHMGIAKMLADSPDIELHSCYNHAEVTAALESLKPTVILQDINMPDTNGLSLLAEYRSSANTARVPVLMLSATSDAQVKAEAFRQGANDYIVKMPDVAELVARVRYHSSAYNAHMERESALKALEDERRKLKQAYKELERSSSLDGLTGIANRRHFDVTFAAEWRRLIRDKQPISLIMIDVDFFKPYNDSYGHQAGDECLKLVAEVLAGTTKRPSDLVARYGGEEFIALLPITAANGAMLVAELMRESIQAMGLPHGGSTVSEVVTISAGIASVVPSINLQAADLLKAADQALYQAKNGGRNRVVNADRK